MSPAARTAAAARQIARTVADSPLVKTAIAGADPNWGRIVSAAGYAGMPFDPAASICGSTISCSTKGAPGRVRRGPGFGLHQRQSRNARLLTFSEGNAAVRFWTTDLTAEYVRLNADYHT